MYLRVKENNAIILQRKHKNSLKTSTNYSWMGGKRWPTAAETVVVVVVEVMVLLMTMALLLMVVVVVHMVVVVSAMGNIVVVEVFYECRMV